MGKKIEQGKKAVANTAGTAGKAPAKPIETTATPVAASPAPAIAEKKARAKRTVSKTTAAPAAPKAAAISSDEIALRAYFIAEKRNAQGLPGDPHQDWIEAERQLRAEAKKSSSKPSSK